MDVFKDLYQQLIIDHNHNPQNFRRLENPSHSAEGHNPLCGDEITVSFPLFFELEFFGYKS